MSRDIARRDAAGRDTSGRDAVDLPATSRPTRIYPGYAFDLDGTVYLGDALLPCAAETIETIRRAGSRIVYVTNKPLHTAADYARKLTRLGVPTARSEVVTSVDALVDYLRREHPHAMLLAVAEQSAIDELAEDAMAGYFEEVAQTREMLNSRYDDLKSGSVKPIDGEEAYRRLMEKTEAQRQRRRPA